MKVSIITACFNSESTIEDTLKSVTGQDYPDIEYIVVDGLSKDKTLSIVRSYQHRISKVTSEADAGIYDALNKGISQATGDIVGILHSDDCYAHPKVVSRVVNLLSTTHADSLYADLEYVAKEDPSKIVRLWRSKEYRHGMFTKGWMPPHPTFFIKRSCYQSHGTFATTLRTSADYELMLRMLHKHRISVCYLPEVIVKMKTGGQSNASFTNRVKANREDKLAWKMNGLKPGMLTFLMKPLSKLGQYLSHS